jgi:hypothetical protein
MPSDPRSSQESPIADAWAGLTVLLFVVRCVSVPHELVARRLGSRGRDYPGWPIAVGGAVVVPLAAATVVPPSYGVGVLWAYLWGLPGLAVLHAAASRWQSVHVHRHYVGDSWWPSAAGRRWEWLLGGGVAVYGFALCDTLGVLHAVSLIAATFCQAVMDERDDRLRHRLRDAAVEAEYYGSHLAGR